MKNARMNISHFRFILFNLNIFGEIVTTFSLFCILVGKPMGEAIASVLAGCLVFVCCRTTISEFGFGSGLAELQQRRVFEIVFRR